jgi:serine protease AprX
VTVALLDTGVAPSPDLSKRVLPVTDKVTGATSPCQNLSGEPTCVDGYGHGTFMAGIIAGNGASSNGVYKGIAPRANLVSIKVGASDGSADVSNVLAGIQWAVSFRDRYNIRVLNLSLGTNSTQSWQVDPLNYAVERAWAAGIAVVVSASNRGPAPGTISKPADDPWVITVGAVDDRQTKAVSDDRSPDFSGRGPTAEGVAKPDVAAPGAHLVSLRSVGSTIDQQFPTYVAGAYRQGSGTSMAAAVVSGVSALVLSAQPAMAPNRLKYALSATARRAAMTAPTAVGSGVVDAYGAVTAPPGLANVGLQRSTGTGELGLSRGTVVVQTNDPLQTVVQGSQTAQLLIWDPVGYLTGDWSGRTWYATPWYTARWYATTWYGDPWVGHNWEGCSWDGGHDTDCFYGHNWEGSAWYGAWD